jgi:two-component system response regulator RegA
MTDEKHSILLVDDDDIFRNRMAKALTRRGHHVLTASSYRGGVEIIAQQRPEYAIVDLKMAGKSGLEVIRTGIRHHPDIRIVVLTGYGSIATATDAIKLGAIGYLTKPADIEDIMNVLVCTDTPKPMQKIQPPSLARVEWEHINRILNDCDNNISMAAKRLGIHRRTLQRKLQKYPPLV